MAHTSSLCLLSLPPAALDANLVQILLLLPNSKLRKHFLGFTLLIIVANLMF
jgi:hypothetical protein